MARAIPLAVLSLLLAGSVAMGSGLGQLRAQMNQADTDKDADATIELARRILAISPRDTDAWTDFVYYQIANKDYERALASLAAWEKVEKSQVAAIEDYRGDIYLAQENPGAAEKAWRASIAAKPGDYHVLSKLADLLEDQERWPEVLALRTRAAAAKPGAALLAAKAGALLHAHQWDAANAAIQKANNLDATDETVQLWLPKLELIAPAFPGLAALDAKIAANPKDPGPLLDQAEVFAQFQQPAMALYNAERALALAPGSVQARVQAGEAELDLGKPDAAAKFKVSHDLKREPNGQVLPQALHELGLRDAAVAKNPGQPGPLAARSKALRNLNQYVLALDDAQAALALDANSPDAEFEMGHDLDALGRPGEALPHIVHSTELRPNDPVAWYYRGVIEANRADYKAAIASQTRSLSIRESAVALEARADAELRLGLAAEAATDNQRLEQLGPPSPQ